MTGSPRIGARRRVLAALATAALLLPAAPAARAASTVRVDDSGTIVNQPVVPMRWRKPAPSRAQDNNVDGAVRVALRLNMAPFLNQQVRLFMGLAPVTGDPVSASWRTQGRLLPGTVRSGGRTLIFNGVASSARIEETIDMTLSTDGRNMADIQTLQFFFEVDLP
ncbi:hypothetical protein ACFPOE_01370 [Caenimonas terrae]|uniref:Uncharacterized protein n=1 Tax=Caenimonas terrae TaxID=696074 RepID=A0ABW0N6R7_9BURK